MEKFYWVFNCENGKTMLELFKERSFMGRFNRRYMDMSTAKQIQYTAEEQARIEIRNFVNDGLRDLQKGNVQNFDEAFDEIESRYMNVRV